MTDRRIGSVGEGSQTGVTISTTQTLSNKKLIADLTTLIDQTDNTKIIKFDTSGITTGTTRTMTVPDVSDTFIVSSAVQGLSNKKLTADNTTFIDLTDNTKVFKIQASSIATGTTRTMTVPDMDFTPATGGGTATGTNTGDEVAASTTVSGIVELLTDAETVTGTDTTRAATAANLTAKMKAPGAIGGTTPGQIDATKLTCNTDLEINTDQRIAYSMLIIKNNAGTLQHAWFYDGGQAGADTFDTQFQNATTTFTNTPTGTDATTAMANGGKIRSSGNDQFIIDTNQQTTAGDNFLISVLAENNTSNTFNIGIRMNNSDVNGTTRVRPHLIFSDNTGAAFNLNTTSIPSGKLIRIILFGFLH